ncbi:ribosomal RNA-processing protein 7-domain-containing protein [Infundibulicybe gibba]|nr:ribosomal RNA-processing protein 7-domain-containing protein [Infundibulicybe gibba]
MSFPSTVNGFAIIPISYSPSSEHYIYARLHLNPKNGKQPNTLPDQRTLFLANVPPDATEREIVVLFKNCGTIERIIFDMEPDESSQLDSDDDDEMAVTTDAVEDAAEGQTKSKRKPKKNERPKFIPLPEKPVRTLRATGRTAHVIFLDSSSLDRALSSASKPRPWPKSPEPSGLLHYTELYDSLRPPLDAVKQHADSAMELYEFELAKTKQKSKYRKGEAIIDEDGFTLVTRGGAYGQTLGGGVAVASKRFQATGQSKRIRSNKKDKNEKAGFYAFQKAEKQRSELMNLKKRWEADKEKVEKLKASRRFKPY